jgi:hypothetical protein
VEKWKSGKVEKWKSGAVPLATTGTSAVRGGPWCGRRRLQTNFVTRTCPHAGNVRAVVDSMTRNGSVTARRHNPILCVVFIAVVVVMLPGASVGTPRQQHSAEGAAPDQLSQLWQEPPDIAARDLLAGPGGHTRVPPAGVPFTFVAADRGGYSPGYEVRDVNGLPWSVKLGPEAQSEVVSSRLLWAIGYHQPPTYYLASWTMTGGPPAPGPARFRPEGPDRRVVGEWSWYENDFVRTQPFKGLLVANLILNNWDWKTSNNKIYQVSPSDGSPEQRMYVVRDLGASLGRTSFPALLNFPPMRRLAQGSRNDLEGFERQGFIRRITPDRVEFEYRGTNQAIVDTLTPADVAWTCALLSRLSDAQWNDAFRAGGYPPEQGGRYVAKLKSKVAEGLRMTDAFTRSRAGAAKTRLSPRPAPRNQLRSLS